MEVGQNIKQTVFEQYLKNIKENSSNMQEISKFVALILEDCSINTYSEFLQLPAVTEVNYLLSDVAFNHFLIKMAFFFVS
jgi:hypothetical protein